MPFQIQQVDLPGVFQAASAVNANRSQNALAQQKTRNQILLEQRTAQGNALATQYFKSGGKDVKALNALASVDPQKAAQVQTFTANQNKLVEEKRQKEAAEISRKVLFVMNSKSKVTALKIGFPEYAKSLAEQEGVNIDELTEDDVLRAGQALLDHYGPIAGLAPEDVAPESKTVKFRDASGNEVTALVDDEGNVIQEIGRGPTRQQVEEGPPGSFDLSKRTEGSLEEGQFNAVKQLSRISEIESSFKPEFQELSTQFEALGTSVKSRLGVDVSPEDRKKLSAFAVFKKRAISNVNRTLNELSGAAVSPAEAERLKAELPDPGTGFIGGDDPISFEAKMLDATALLRAAIIRFNMARRRGLDPLNTGIELADIPSLIDARGEELFDLLKAQNPDADDSAIEDAVRAQLAEEFGGQ